MVIADVMPSSSPPALLQGKHIGIDDFGASAPAPVLYEKFGITQAKVVEAAKAVMA